MRKILKSLINKEYLFLYLIIFFGAVLRFPGIFTNSFAYTYDVGRDMLALWNIAVAHKIPLIGATTGLPGIFYGPWWYYLLTPFFILFSGNPQGIALVMALVGLLTIIFSYFFGKELGGKLLGLIFASLVAVSPSLVSLSGQIWNPNITPLFVVLILLVLNKIYDLDKKHKSKLFFLLGILLALNIDLEIVFGLLLSVGIVFSITLIVNKRITFKNILFFFLGSLVIFSPRIIFELRHQFLMTKTLINFFLGTSSLHSFPSIFVLIFQRLEILFNQFIDTATASSQVLGVIILAFIAISIIFLNKRLDKSVNNFIKTSLVVIFVFLLGTVFFSHDIWPHYLVGLPIFYIILFGLSVYILFDKFKNKLIPAFFFAIILILNFNPISVVQGLTTPLWEGDASVYRNQVAVIDYVYKEANGKPFKYVVYTPPVYDYTYRYLFDWYGQRKYHYLPPSQANLAFFILEPDLQMPSRLTDWLKQREQDGKIIKSEKVKGGIIVQTRIH